MSGLTDFQVQVARIFFALPESAGLLVAGGAALIAQELIDRETRDLDLFASPRPRATSPTRARARFAVAQHIELFYNQKRHRSTLG